MVPVTMLSGFQFLPTCLGVGILIATLESALALEPRRVLQGDITRGVAQRLVLTILGLAPYHQPFRHRLWLPLTHRPEPLLVPRSLVSTVIQDHHAPSLRVRRDVVSILSRIAGLGLEAPIVALPKVVHTLRQIPTKVRRQSSALGSKHVIALDVPRFLWSRCLIDRQITLNQLGVFHSKK